MDKGDVMARVDDWERRLQNLCEEVDQFYNKLPKTGFMDLLKGQILQNEERLMREFEVPPRMLPTRAVLYDRNRVSFVPSAIWIVGANGRVNVITNQGQFILVDTAGNDGQPSNWQIVTPANQTKFVSFDLSVFTSLVIDQTLTKAA